MAASNSNSSITLGYLTFVRLDDHGIVGGYLLVNERARPIEFHCTAPVRSTRVQEILYGSTHQSALLCDQIGHALLQQAEKCSALANLILSNEPEVAGLRHLTGIPLALFVANDEGSSSSSQPSTDSVTQGVRNAGSLNTQWSFEHSGHSLTNASDFPEDRDSIRETLLNVTGGWDLSEPLERIRAAIQEAQRAAA